MATTLYRGGIIHSSADPFAEALLVADGVITWIGANDTADGLAHRADRVIELDGALVAPAFVDAHVHTLETGLALTGVDLSPAGGVHSLDDALTALATAARERPSSDDHVLRAFGWDETTWPEHRAPTRTELDHATAGARVYAARVDVHSAVVSTALAEHAGLSRYTGWSETGWVTTDANDAARDAARDITSAQRTALYTTVLDHAAAHGIAAIHENSAPHIDTRDGLRELLATTADPASAHPLVVGYRGELCETADEARHLLADIPGLTGIGGDLDIDGSLGSRTAALTTRYADLHPDLAAGTGGPDGHGLLYLGAEQIANHLSSVTRAGTQGGFHVIGDRAMDEFLLGLKVATDIEGQGPLRARGHRIEHAPMVDADALASLLLLGIGLSIQPAFDATWGGPHGMYASRVGPTRINGMNAFSDLASAGIPLALGSDAPVTPIDPWAAIRASLEHADPDQRISARAAFRAHTRGGWRLARLEHTGAGELRVGAPAHLAVWKAEHYAVQGGKQRTNSWSTDARSGTPLLPALGPNEPAPTCLHTMRDGIVIHDTL